MLCNESPEGFVRTPLRWKIPLQLGSSADADLCWAVFEVLPALRRERKRKGWTIFSSKESLGEEPGQRLRGHPCPAPWALSSSPKETLAASREGGLWQPPLPEPLQLPTGLLRSKKSHLWMLSLKKQQRCWVFLAWTEESFCSSYSPHADSAQQLSSSVLFLSQGFLKHHFEAAVFFQPVSVMFGNDGS